MKKKLVQKMITLSKTLDRRPEEKQLLESRSNRALKLLIFFSILGVAGTLFGPPLYKSVQQLSQDVRPIGSNPDLWTVRYDVGEVASCDQMPMPKTCLAHPENHLLWKSKHRRHSKEHRKWVFENQGKGFWLGAVFGKDVLREALEKGANHLLLGYLIGEAKIWVGGRLFVHQLERTFTPVAVTVPKDFLAERNGLQVGILLLPRSKMAYPDYLNSSEGAEGFVTVNEIEAHRGYQSLITRVRPVSLLLGNILIAFLFIFFWSNVSIKQEYFYLALFALVEAINQFRIIDWVRQPLSGSGITYHYLYGSRLLQGLLALFLGLAFARKTRQTFVSALTVFGLFAVLLTLTNPQALDQFRLSSTLAKYWIPFGAMLGAGVCFSTAYTLYQDHLRRDYLSLRIRRLTHFGLALLAFGSIQFLFGATVNLLGKTGIVQYLAYFSSVIVLGAITIRDYRESEQLRNDLTSLSEILELARSKKPVSGAALYIDLKGSEHLIREGEARGDAGIYLRRIMKSLCDAIGQSGGVRFTIDGDMIKSFFPNRANGAGVAVAMDGVWITMQALEKETKVLRSEGVLAANATLAARFGLAVGNVQALIVDTGPIFEHVDDTSPLLDAARMLHIEEKEFSDQKNTSFVVMTAESKALLENKDLSSLGTWIGPEIQANAKHGVVYEAAVFAPHQAPSDERTKLAA